MKTRSRMPLIYGLATFVLVGCNSPLQSPPIYYSPSEVSPSEVAAATAERRAAHSYALYEESAVVGGRVTVFERPFKIGTISFDVTENKIFWNGQQMLFLQRDKTVYQFFEQTSKTRFRINPAVGGEDNTASVDLEIFSDMPNSQFASTRWQPGASFVKDFTGLEFPTNYVGLLATSKTVDGTPVELNSFEFVGSVQLTPDSCLLNQSEAHAARKRLSTSVSALLITNGTSRLGISPDGNWAYCETKDTGIWYSGSEPGLGKLYLMLRDRTPVSSASDSLSEQPYDLPKGSGTGFFITDDGYLLTCAHVVEDAGRVEVTIGGKRLRAEIVKVDRANDMAVLKVTGSYIALPVASSRAVTLGDSVFTIGFPNPPSQGVEPKYTQGEISSLSGFQDDPRQFQISAPIQPGNSGGPLVDRSGNAIGLVTSRLGDLAALADTGSLPQNVNYTLKSSFIMAFLETLPDLSAKLKGPRPPTERPLPAVAAEVNQSVVLVTVY